MVDSLPQDFRDVLEAYAAEHAGKTRGYCGAARRILTFKNWRDRLIHAWLQDWPEQRGTLRMVRNSPGYGIPWLQETFRTLAETAQDKERAGKVTMRLGAVHHGMWTVYKGRKALCHFTDVVKAQTYANEIETGLDLSR